MIPEEVARLAAAGKWSCRTTEVFHVVPATARFPWIAKHHVLVAGDYDRRALVFVDRKGGSVLHEDSTSRARNTLLPARLGSLNRLLAIEGVTLPYDLDAPALADAVRTILLGSTGGFVCSRALFERERGAIRLWTSPSPEVGPALFERCCADPVLTRREGGAWELRFFYFNDWGGIESWTVTGDPRALGDARLDMAAANRTFSLPYA